MVGNCSFWADYDNLAISFCILLFFLQWETFLVFSFQIRSWLFKSSSVNRNSLSIYLSVCFSETLNSGVALAPPASPLSIWMSHWHHKMVDAAKFWISCHWLNLLRKASHWQLIQNLAPSTMVWCQWAAFTPCTTYQAGPKQLSIPFNKLRVKYRGADAQIFVKSTEVLRLDKKFMSLICLTFFF